MTLPSQELMKKYRKPQNPDFAKFKCLRNILLHGIRNKSFFLAILFSISKSETPAQPYLDLFTVHE